MAETQPSPGASLKAWVPTNIGPWQGWSAVVRAPMPIDENVYKWPSPCISQRL